MDPAGRPERRLGLVVGLSCLAYAPLWALDTGVRGDHAVDVVLAFLVLPAVLLLAMRERPELGALDGWLALGVAVYMPFALWFVLVVPSHGDYFREWARLDEGAPYVVGHAALVAANVASVDFFCRRVVQLEASRAWGDRRGFAVATVAWLVGHVPEAIWLDDLVGLAAGVSIIVLAGVATGLVYMRGRNVAGLMLGHATLNIVIIAGTALLTG